MNNGPKTHNVRDIWEMYAYQLLAANPTWVGVNDSRRNLFPRKIVRKCREDGKLVVNEVIDYYEYKEVIEKFFVKAKTETINGGMLNLGHSLGKIVVRCVERNHNKRVIDHYKTKLQPKVWSEEKNKMVPKHIVYFTEDWWCRIGWHRTRSIPNETVYEFKPTRGLRSGQGFAQLLHTAVTDDPTMRFNYVYYPLKQKK